MFGLDIDMASIRRDVDKFFVEMVATRKAVETNNALVARLIELEETK